MNIKTISNAVTRVGGRSLLQTKKHSPQILTVVGVASGIASTVLVAKATLKAQPVLADIRDDVALVKELKTRVNEKGSPVIDSNEYREELTKTYVRGGIKLIKLYGPGVSFGVIGIVSHVSAQTIMQSRNAGLTAAYVAAEKAFSEYRKRVEASVGTEKERALRYGITEEEKHDTKAGTVTKVQSIDPNAVSLYARFFDELNPNWTRVPEYNMAFLKNHQNYANDLLHARGHVFLNDVYDALGIERSSAGAVVGWVLSKDGDNFIDFGLLRNTEAVHQFVNGNEHSILLDFNVDGLIYDKI